MVSIQRHHILKLLYLVLIYCTYYCLLFCCLIDYQQNVFLRDSKGKSKIAGFCFKRSAFLKVCFFWSLSVLHYSVLFSTYLKILFCFTDIFKIKILIRGIHQGSLHRRVGKGDSTKSEHMRTRGRGLTKCGCPLTRVFTKRYVRYY